MLPSSLMVNSALCDVQINATASSSEYLLKIELIDSAVKTSAIVKGKEATSEWRDCSGEEILVGEARLARELKSNDLG